MNRPQATISEILGHNKVCVFSRYGTNPFKYDPCRDCEGKDVICDNYISTKINGQHEDRSTKKPFARADISTRTPSNACEPDRRVRDCVVSKTSYVAQSVRLNYDKIRRYNDQVGGVE